MATLADLKTTVVSAEITVEVTGYAKPPGKALEAIPSVEAEEA
jgi:hypothetical protein